MQRRRTPERQPQPLAPEGGHVTQLLTHRHRRMQIMMFDQQRVETRLFLCFHQPYRQMIENMLLVRVRTPKS